MARPRCRKLTGIHHDCIFTLSWSPCGGLLLTGSRGGALSIYDADRHSVLRLDLLDGTPRSASWSPDGTRILVTMFNGDAWVQTARGDRERLRGRWHLGAWAPDSPHDRFATTSTDMQAGLTVWDRGAPTQLGAGLFARDLCWSQDGRHIFLSTVNDMTVFTPGQPVCRFYGPGNRVAADDRGVLAAWGRTVYRYMPDGQHELVRLTNHAVQDISWTPDGPVILTERELVPGRLLFRDDPARRIATGPRYLAVGHLSGAISLWRLKQGSVDTTASALAVAALEGDHVARFALADYLEESNHPLAPTWSYQLRAGNLYPAGALCSP